MAEQGITEPKGVISQSLGDLEIGQNYFFIPTPTLRVRGSGFRARVSETPSSIK